MAEIVRRGGNHPIRIGASGVVYRAQSWDMRNARTPNKRYQLGTIPAIGTQFDPWTYRATLEVTPIDTQVERLLTAKSGANDTVTLTDFLNATGLQIYTPDESLVGAVIESLRYQSSVPNNVFTATYNLRGTSEGAKAVITDPTTSGLLSYMPKHIEVRFDSFPTKLLRIKSMDINLALRSAEWFEFSNANPWYVDRTEPATTFTLTWYKSRDATTPETFDYDTRPKPDEGSPDGVEIQLIPAGGAWDAAGNLQFILTNVVTSDVGRNVRVNAEANDEISYTADSATTGGFSVKLLGP